MKCGHMSEVENFDVLQFDIRFIIQKTVLTSIMAAWGQGSGFKGAVGWANERTRMTSVFF